MRAIITGFAAGLVLTPGPLASFVFAANPTGFEVDERTPVAFVLSTPTGRPARVRSSELIRRIDRHLRADTNFALQSLSADVVQECRGRLGCLAQKARPDYEPSALRMPDGRKLPYREHVRRMKARQITYPRYLIVVSNVTLPDRPDRISIVLVDTDLALQLLHETRRDRAEWRDAFEARVDSGAIAGEPATAEVRSADEADAFFARYLRRNVRRRLERTGHWRPFGSIRIDTDVQHAAILWDGRTVGSTDRGSTMLTQAKAGPHSLTLQHPDYRDATTEVNVRPGETVNVTISLEAKPQPSPLGRQVMLWAGVGLVVAGGTLGAYALARQDSDATTFCIGRTCESGTGFLSSGYTPDADINEDINPSGVLVGPLGYSLAATGAAWSLGTLLTDDDEFPWWALVIGVAAGGVSYGLSAALNGP